MRNTKMNYHAPITAGVSKTTVAAAMPKGIPVRELGVRVGAIVDYDEITLPSGERYYGGADLVTSIREGEIRVMGRWLPVSGIRQVLTGFTAGETDTRYEPDDTTLIELYERMSKAEDTRRSPEKQYDAAFDKFKRVCAGRGISDSGPDGQLIQPRERLMEVRQLEREVMVETGYEAISDRVGRLDMLAAMLRTAILMMPANTPRGAAAKLHTLLRDYADFELDEGYTKKHEAILRELRQMDNRAGTNNENGGDLEIQLPTDIDQIPISSLYVAAQALDTASDILAHMADMGTIEDRRAGFFMEEVGNTVRTAWTRLLEHVRDRAPTDAKEASLRKFMIASARLTCSGFTNDLAVTGSGLTSWLAEPATEKEAA